MRFLSRQDMVVVISAVLALVSGSGCAEKRSMIDAFPPGSIASPWVLIDDVWSGTFEQASPGIGAEAEKWRRFSPQRVWLASYKHDQRPQSRLTVRAFAFETAAAARAAYDHFEPIGPARRPFEAGDRGCWTDDGVMFVWGRLVFDIFASSPTQEASAEQAVYLCGHIERRMNAELAGAPR